MPNWCETTYKCVGNPKEVRLLHKAIEANSKRKTPYVPNGFGTLWLGCIINYLGGNWENYRCRGHILDFGLEEDGTTLNIYQDTAWCEQEGFRKFIEETFPSIKVYYMEVEPGCEVFCTNDAKGKYFPVRYFLDSYDEPLYFDTIEEAAECVSSIVGHDVRATVDAVSLALDDYMEEHEDDEREIFYSFHDIIVCDD